MNSALHRLTGTLTCASFINYILDAFIDEAPQEARDINIYERCVCAV